MGEGIFDVGELDLVDDSDEQARESTLFAGLHGAEESVGNVVEHRTPSRRWRRGGGEQPSRAGTKPSKDLCDAGVLESANVDDESFRLGCDVP